MGSQKKIAERFCKNKKIEKKSGKQSLKKNCRKKFQIEIP